MKNLLPATPRRRIVYLSETYEGSYSEKRMADEQAFSFDRSNGGLLALLMDLGFPACQAKGAHVVRPHQKPRGGSLSDEQKTENQQKARERVVVEHAISAVKVFRVVKQIIRSWLHERRDKVLLLACGLHNFRLACRAPALQP